MSHRACVCRISAGCGKRDDAPPAAPVPPMKQDSFEPLVPSPPLSDGRPDSNPVPGPKPGEPTITQPSFKGGGQPEPKK